MTKNTEISSVHRIPVFGFAPIVYYIIFPIHFEHITVEWHPNIYDNLALAENNVHDDDEIQGLAADQTAILQRKPKKKDIKILTVNCRGLRSKETNKQLCCL